MASSKDVKTTVTDVDPRDFISEIADERQRADSERLLELFGELTGAAPRMWGPTMIGFGAIHYRYATGNEGDTFVVGFAPRKGKFALYGLLDAPDAPAKLEALGKYSRGAGCLYVPRLNVVDEDVLRDLISLGWTSVESRSNDHVTITPLDLDQ